MAQLATRPSFLQRIYRAELLTRKAEIGLAKVRGTLERRIKELENENETLRYANNYIRLPLGIPPMIDNLDLIKFFDAFDAALKKLQPAPVTLPRPVAVQNTKERPSLASLKLGPQVGALTRGRGRPPHFDPEEKLLLREIWSKRPTLKKIAEHKGCSESAVVDALYGNKRKYGSGKKLK